MAGDIVVLEEVSLKKIPTEAGCLTLFWAVTEILNDEMCNCISTWADVVSLLKHALWSSLIDNRNRIILLWEKASDGIVDGTIHLHRTGNVIE